MYILLCKDVLCTVLQQNLVSLAKAKKLPQMKAVIDVIKGFVVFLLCKCSIAIIARTHEGFIDLSATMESISFGFKVAVLELYFTSEVLCPTSFMHVWF